MNKWKDLTTKRWKDLEHITWREVRLEEIADINMGQSPKSIYYNNLGEGIRFLQGNRTFGRIYPTFDTYTTKITKLANKGDILFTVRAPVGDMNIANYDLCIGRGIVAIRGKENHKFLYYSLIHNTELLKTAENGTTYGSINKSDLENFKIKIPDLETQEKIADILSTYDRLIENNNRRIEILEKTAEEIYKEWFVRMRFPGHENTKFIKGIPEGWEVKRVGNITPILTGKKDANYAEDNGKYLFFTCSQTPLRSNGYSFDSHSVILAGNGDFNVKIYRGKFEAYQRTYVLTPHDNKYLYLLYFIIEKNIDWLINQAAGTVIRYLTRGMIERIPLLIPNNHLLNYYNEHIKNIFELRDNIELQNQNLIKQRDLLLPRLMNGTIDRKSVV